MNNMFLYLIQVTSVFIPLYLLYIVFLKKLTFHKVNRIVLLLLLPVSVLIPFSKELLPSIASRIVEIPLFEPIAFDTIGRQLQNIEQPLVTPSFYFPQVLMAIYWLVFSLYIIRIFTTARKLYLLRAKAIIKQKDGYHLAITNVSEIFSYFKWIFIPNHQFENYDHQILEHEKAHIELKHSWDVMLTEIYIAFFWFNPLVYAYRKSLKSVHEFQADNGVLQKGIKTSEYMQLLLQSLEIQKPNNLYNYFNQPILKKRVTMMTKPKSNRLTKLKYFLLLPVCVLLISAFTTQIMEDNEYLNIKTISEYISSPPSVFPINNSTKKDITAFFGKKGKHPKVNKDVLHTGIDIRANLGTPILATADGSIAKAAMQGNWGNLIVITHTDGYETWYAHLKGFNVNEKQEVKKGDIIGYVGNTGLSTGPHLHYEVKQNGKHLNPLDFLE